MKREGRQHGLVWTYAILPSPWNPTPQHRYVNSFNSPPTAGLFTKVSPKPTNHSKFTGKCNRVRCTECHVPPAGKAKDKAKWTLKRRTAEVGANNRLITWRAVDDRPGLNFSGFSATGILDHLAGVDYMDDHEGDECDYNAHTTCEETHGMDHSQSGLILDSDLPSSTIGHDHDHDGDRMSFCDVGFVWEQVDGDEDGWCLVELM